MLATSNRGKVADLRICLAGVGVEIVTPTDLRLNLEVAETGSTYLENARLKARAYFEAAHLPTVGEDSGLEIDALGGQPGLYSARWLGLPDGPIKNSEVLRQLAPIPSSRRGGRYRCAIVLIEDSGAERVFEGRCAGKIAPGPAGDGGFGFDPIFLIPRLGRTLAELDDAERIRVNHRGRAARQLARYLRRAAKTL